VPDIHQAPNPPAGLLEWVWAYRQALVFLDRFDAEWLNRAESCEIWPEESWHRFLNIYRLKRGKSHAELRNKRAEIFAKLIPIFKEPLGPTSKLEQLQQRWQKAVEILGELCMWKTKSGRDPTLWSMTSKLLWFYHPEFMTMYDKNTSKGLAHQPGLSVPYKASKPQENYLQRFEELFKKKSTAIDKAEQFSNRQYPYPRRVLDQWLWLQGNRDKEVLVNAFRSSVEKAPILPHESIGAPQPPREEAEATTPSLKAEILAIGKRCAALPDRDLRSASEILGYDEHGLPK
jgi:hypothetical protein